MKQRVLKIEELGQPGSLTAETVNLTYRQRRLSRQRVRLNNGSEVVISLPEDTILQDGDRLRSSAGRVIMVRAAAELISVGVCLDPALFSRACYLLGTRNVVVEIQRGRVMYQVDRALDRILRDMRLIVMHEIRVFEPDTPD